MLSAALLTCAGLFLKSFWTIKATDLGIKAEEVLGVQLQSLDQGALASGSDAEHDIYRRALTTLRAIEGTERSALAIGLPFVSSFGMSIWVPGLDSIPELPGGGPFLNAVSGRYFETVGTPVLRGGPITDDHVARGDRVVVVSEATAARLWPGADPLGACIRIGAKIDPCAEVIGVVADVHRQGYREPPSMQLYIPLAQERGLSGTSLVVRPSGAPTAIESRIASILSTSEPLVDHVEVTRLDTLIADQIRPWQLGAVVLTLVSLIAALVSLVGVYGVLSFSVAQRYQEIGVRMALGASTYSIRNMILRFGLTTAGFGVTSGIVLVLAGSRWISPLLFETSIADANVIAAVAALLGSATVVACVLPARLATRVDPAICLRADG